jgi:hypothetical protein
MHLELGEALRECGQDVGGELLSLDEDEVGALQEGEEVLRREGGGVLHHPGDDRVQTVDEVLLFDVERAASADFDYLEGAQKCGYDVLNLCRVGVGALSDPIWLEFEIDELPQHVDQIPDNFDVDVLGELRYAQEYALHQR